MMQVRMAQCPAMVEQASARAPGVSLDLAGVQKCSVSARLADGSSICQGPSRFSTRAAAQIGLREERGRGRFQGPWDSRCFSCIWTISGALFLSAVPLDSKTPVLA